LNQLGQFNPGVKRGADDANVDDRPATRHSDSSLSRISISSAPNDSIEHSPSSSGSSDPGSPDRPPSLPPDLPPVSRRSRHVTADLPADGPSAFLRSRGPIIPVISYPPDFRPPKAVLDDIHDWSQSSLSRGSRGRGATIAV
jgi:hypothetical protein